MDKKDNKEIDKKDNKEMNKKVKKILIPAVVTAVIIGG